MIRLALLFAAAAALASCLAAAAIGTAGAVVGAAVGIAGAVVGAGVDAVTPDDEDGESTDDDD